jgi:hypothetical protein
MLPKVKATSPPRYIEKEGTSSEMQKRPVFKFEGQAYKLTGYNNSLLYRLNQTGIASPCAVYESRRESMEGHSRRDSMEGLPMVKTNGSSVNLAQFIGGGDNFDDSVSYAQSHLDDYGSRRRNRAIHAPKKASVSAASLIDELLGPPPTRNYKMATERARELCAKSEKFHYCWTGDSSWMGDTKQKSPKKGKKNKNKRHSHHHHMVNQSAVDTDTDDVQGTD